MSKYGLRFRKKITFLNVREFCAAIKKLNVLSVSECVATESWRTEIINLM